MLDLSHALDEQAVIELEAKGKDSLQIDRLADLVRNPATPASMSWRSWGWSAIPGIPVARCARAAGLSPRPGARIRRPRERPRDRPGPLMM